MARLRTDRIPPDGLHLCDLKQRKALQAWLLDSQEEHPDAPKFIFSGSVVAPVEQSFQQHPETWRNRDNWAAYPDSLAWLVRLIVEQRIRNVVFVGGDLHLSAVAELQLCVDGRPPVRATQVVASGLYAPLPFANARPGDYLWDAPAEVPVTGHADVRIHYKATLLTDARSHFVKVMARKLETGWQVRARAYDSTGEAIGRDTENLLEGAGGDEGRGDFPIRMDECREAVVV